MRFQSKLLTAASPAATPQQVPQPTPQLTDQQLQKLVDDAASATYQAPQAVDPTQTPEFKKWFGKSVVVNSDGTPKRVYHGSTHNFESFDMSNANPENHYGKGLYFTDSQVDVSRNYGTNEGADLTSRIEQRAEQITQEILDSQEIQFYYNYSNPEHKELFEKAKEKARQEIAGDNQGVVYVTYLRILKPVIVQKNGGTYFELEYDEDTGDETGTGVKLWQACIDAGRELGVDGQAVWSRASEAVGLYDGFNAYDFEQGVRQDCYLIDDGCPNGQFISTAYRLMGFDGIVQKDADQEFKNMGMTRGTTHYIVWNPRQVKSAIGNSGKFSPRSPKMTASKEASWGDAVDFSKDPAWHDLFFGKPTPERVKELGAFIRQDPNRFFTLYHGTDGTLPIMEHGLLPTSTTRRRSLQSGSGYVYLSVFPGMAEDFGRMGNPDKPIQVYAVSVTAKRLLPDADQLRNRRQWGGDTFKDLGSSLAESLVYGHGARVKGKIDPFQIQPTKDIKPATSEQGDEPLCECGHSKADHEGGGCDLCYCEEYHAEE